MIDKREEIKRCLNATPTFNYDYLTRQGFGFSSVQWLVKEKLLIHAGHNIYYDPKLDQLPIFSRNCIIATSLNSTNPICLQTSLYLYKYDINQPNTISIAKKKGDTIPQRNGLPIEYHSFSKQYHKIGTCYFDLSGYKIYSYNKEKTICDCFRFRKELGKDTIITAMKCFLLDSLKDMKRLLKYRDTQRMNKAIFNEWLVEAMSNVHHRLTLRERE